MYCQFFCDRDHKSIFEYFGAEETARDGAMPTVQFLGFKGQLCIYISLAAAH